MPKIEKESDTLNREYRQNARMMERLTKRGTWDKIEPAFRELQERQYHIAKGLEECTGVKILQTEEEYQQEMKILQERHEAMMRKVETAIWKGKNKRRQKSLPSKVSKFIASSAPGQTTLDDDDDMTDQESKK